MPQMDKAISHMGISFWISLAEENRSSRQAKRFVDYRNEEAVIPIHNTAEKIRRGERSAERGGINRRYVQLFSYYVSAYCIPVRHRLD